MSDFISDTSIVVGDFNARNSLWYTPDTIDNRGEKTAEWLDEADLGILNEDTPTRIFNNTETSPDLSLATPNLLPAIYWSTLDALSSDHLPILLSLVTDIERIKAPKRTYINFKKADWESFRNYIEEKLQQIPLTDNVHKSEKQIRTTIQRAAKRFIPAGRIPLMHNAVDSETAKLIDERNGLRAQNPTDPHITELNEQINTNIKEHKRAKWLEHLNNCGPGTKTLWSTIKHLNSGPRQLENQSISFNGKAYSKPKKIANCLNRQFTPNSTTRPTKEFRRTLRTLKKKKTSDAPITITPTMIEAAIKKSKNSKAIGPDRLSPIMIKNLGPVAIAFLANLFTNSINQSITPPLWKVGRIIPLPKPGKPVDEGPSYRPISLLSPLAKLLESVILPTIQSAITLKPHQHGFRKAHSTVTALQSISDHITTGLNKAKPVDRTVLVAIDLSKAFDTVNHELLLKDILDLPLNHHLKSFLAGYLRGRQTFVDFRGAKSKYRKVRQGVPQGAVLSPTLFNLYMSHMPTPPCGH